MRFLKSYMKNSDMWEEEIRKYNAFIQEQSRISPIAEKVHSMWKGVDLHDCEILAAFDNRPAYLILDIQPWLLHFYGILKYSWSSESSLTGKCVLYDELYYEKAPAGLIGTFNATVDDAEINIKFKIIRVYNTYKKSFLSDPF